MKLPDKIETERLFIYPITEEPTKDIFDNFTEEVTEFMTPAPAREISETEEFVKQAMEKNKKGKDFQGYFTTKDGEFLGNVGIHNIDTETPELGIWVKKSAHGNKYGQEAVKALKEWAEHNLHYKYIIYPVAKENIPSRKIPESLGGVIEDEYKRPRALGGEIDCVEYRIYP